MQQKAKFHVKSNMNFKHIAAVASLVYSGFLMANGNVEGSVWAFLFSLMTLALIGAEARIRQLESELEEEDGDDA